MQSGQNPVNSYINLALYLGLSFAIQGSMLSSYATFQAINEVEKKKEREDFLPLEVAPYHPLKQERFQQDQFIKHVNEKKTSATLPEHGACYGFFVASIGRKDMISRLKEMQRKSSFSGEEIKLLKQIATAQEEYGGVSIFGDGKTCLVLTREKCNRFIIENDHSFFENVQYILNSAIQLAIQNLGGPIGIVIEMEPRNHIFKFGAIRRAHKIVFHYFDSNYGKVEFQDIVAVKESLIALLAAYKSKIKAICIEEYTAALTSERDHVIHNFPSKSSLRWVRNSIYSPKKPIESFSEILKRETQAGNPQAIEFKNSNSMLKRC